MDKRQVAELIATATVAQENIRDGDYGRWTALWRSMTYEQAEIVWDYFAIKRAIRQTQEGPA